MKQNVGLPRHTREQRVFWGTIQNTHLQAPNDQTVAIFIQNVIIKMFKNLIRCVKPELFVISQKGIYEVGNIKH